MQRFYGIDLDHAKAGEHTPQHIAALIRCLPLDCAINKANDKDAIWTLEAILLARLNNLFTDFLYGLSDKATRGEKPEHIGPDEMRGVNRRTLDAQVMTINDLMTELAKQRG